MAETTWFYISFADPAGGGWLGACIVRGATMKEALQEAWRLGINPGGEALANGPMSGDEVREGGIAVNRLLSKEDLGPEAVRVNSRGQDLEGRQEFSSLAGGVIQGEGVNEPYSGALSIAAVDALPVDSPVALRCRDSRLFVGVLSFKWVGKFEGKPGHWLYGFARDHTCLLLHECAGGVFRDDEGRRVEVFGVEGPLEQVGRDVV